MCPNGSAFCCCGEGREPDIRVGSFMVRRKRERRDMSWIRRIVLAIVMDVIYILEGRCLCVWSEVDEDGAGGDDGVVKLKVDYKISQKSFHR